MSTTSDTWVLSTADPAAAAAAPAYIGNGFLGTRIPASGAGFVDAPVATQTHAAGIWADVRDLQHDMAQPEGAVSLPGWTTLQFSDGTATYALDRGQVRSYRQALDLRSGAVTTTVSWESPAGRLSDLRYEVLLDRANPRVGVVRLQVTPHWTGAVAVTDILGEGPEHHSDGTPAGLERTTGRVSPGQSSAALTVRTLGTALTVAYACQLDVPAAAVVTGSTGPGVTRLVVSFPVRAGRTYAVTKTVGFATSHDSARPKVTARDAAASGFEQKFEGVLEASTAAWARLWRSDILVPGQPRLQRQLRAALFSLMASVAAPGQPGAGWSLSPVGLSGSGYNGHVFWDTETWMYPALLALAPELAGSVVEYRHRTLDAARAHAAASGHDGARYAWESALTGREVTPEWAETSEYELHITADVALAQWQYYLATGDRLWLARRGWPVISGAAAFWASRATPNDDGGWSLNGVQGPDEHHYPVDDDVYTNVAAATTLRLAAEAGRILGEPVPDSWREVAEGLVVLAPGEAGGSDCVRPEFRGYTGEQVKQAAVVMLTYPWEFPQPRSVDLADLRYYAARYDPDGPAMTDSVNSIVWAQLRPPGCADWTWTRRSLDPFVTPPYDQFTEARSGQGVFTFLTGAGGFLQEFLYGYSGLRWRADRIRLDPTLPPQLSTGLTLRGVRWQGRVVDVAIEPVATMVTLRSGPPTVVEVDGQCHPLDVGQPVTLRTARPDPGQQDDLALCRPVNASSADPSSPAVAAVDGETVTGWAPTDSPAWIEVDLGASARPGEATLAWTGSGSLAYRLELADGGADRWRTVATGSASAAVRRHVTWPARPAPTVRLVVDVARPGLRLAELKVGAGGGPGVRT